MVEPTTNLETMSAFLGKGTEFSGKLTFDGTVKIDGKFDGEIFSKDTLMIGESAEVKSKIIEVGTAVIYGKVFGPVKAKQAIELRAPAILKGDIETPSLLIEKGVIFEGHCKMELETKPAAPFSFKKESKKEPADADDLKF